MPIDSHQALINILLILRSRDRAS